MAAGITACAFAGDYRAAADGWEVSGEARVRYETLEGQFRRGGSGGDQALLFRTLLKAEYDAGAAAFGVELQDSRAYLDDEGTPLGPGVVNPLDILQAYARFDAPGLLGAQSQTAVTLGRQTVSIRSKRQIERVSFANVVRTYTGVHAVTTHERGDALHLVAVSPVARLPRDRDDLNDNALSGDEEEWGRWIWGVHYARADLLGARAPGLWGEAFVYGLTEDDRTGEPTPNRQYATPGGRLYRKPVVGQWDVDIEGALRFGQRRATSAADDTRDLDVFASQLFAAVGYTFDAPWRPRLAAEYYWASGDDDPDDGNFDQYERLFGARRTDLNNTSIHGPLTPANLNAPGARLEVTPGPRWDARIAYSASYLASDTDAWVIARLRDPSGRSGSFIGHALDGRVRYALVPDVARLELGASLLEFGGFAERVPDGPEGDRTLFGYAQLTVTF